MIIGQVTREFREQKFQRSYMWEFLLPDLGGVPGTEVSKLCQEVKFGDYSMNDLSVVRYGPFRAGYAGLFEITEVTATFLKPNPDIVTEYFYQWREKIVSKTGSYFPKANYSKEGFIIMYSTTGEEVERYKLRGLFPKNMPAYNLSYSTEEVVKLEFVLNVDMIEKL